MSRARDRGRLLALACALLGCSPYVQSGLPPLVACGANNPCATPYQCVAEVCEIVSCSCDDDCPPPLLCDVKVSVLGQCLAIPTGTSCDAGMPDGGTSDGGKVDGGAPDAGSPDAG